MTETITSSLPKISQPMVKASAASSTQVVTRAVGETGALKISSVAGFQAGLVDPLRRNGNTWWEAAVAFWRARG